MVPELPSGLQAWLDNHGYAVQHAEQVIGGFAATIYQMTVQKGADRPIELLYKQFAPGRAQEYDLYANTLRKLPSYAPTALGFVNQPDEQGVLIEHAGQSLKSVLRSTNQIQRAELLRSAAVWLADMHVQCEQIGQAWLESGLVGPYPVDSSLAWGKDAVEALNWLSSQNLFNINASTVAELQAIIDWFYPRFPEWMTGRMTITHGDPHTENLMCNRGRWSLIDWEFTCMAPPQRDLAIFLQDILDEDLHNAARTAYLTHLGQHGWGVNDASFRTTYQACVFDNTLMMLGWEVYKFREGHLSQSELALLVTTKLGWLKDSFSQLNTST